MLDSITDSTDMHLSKLWETVEYRRAWYAVVHGVTKNGTQLSSWTIVTMSFTGFFNSFIEIKFTYHKIHLLQCITQLFFFFLVYFTALCSTFFFPLHFHVTNYTLATAFHSSLPLHPLERLSQFSSFWICLFWKHKWKHMVWNFVTEKFLIIKYVFMSMATWNRMATDFFHLL